MPYRYQDEDIALGACIDISEGNFALFELQSSENKDRTLVEEAFVGVYIYRDNRFFFANREMAESLVIP